MFGLDIDWSAILPFIAIGFVAQIVDGAVGMAFGVITSTLLVSVMGVPPAQASARVHLVEMFTTAASGISHILQGNVDWPLFRRLAIPGMIGGAVGAYLLSSIDAAVARPFVMAYLTAIGLYLLFKSRSYRHRPRSPKIVAPLGLFGGFLDAAGGGGWGPVVTSNLLVQGTTPRTTVGTVNASEFLLTTTVSIVFIGQLGWEAFTLATIGLIVGGLAAAPLAATVARRVEPRRLLMLVGLVLTATSAFSLYRALA